MSTKQKNNPANLLHNSSNYLFFLFASITIGCLLLYLFMNTFHALVPFNFFNYKNNAHHYIHDPRAKGGTFDLFNALGQYDAQWYLQIASQGYPSIIHTSTDSHERLTYAFFPLYPLTLWIANIPSNNLLVTAFLFANMLILVNTLSIYKITSTLFTSQLALKTIALIFLFPFSIFFHSYYTEGLFLFFLLWFLYFLVKKSFFLSGSLLGLLYITKGNAFFLYFLYAYCLLKTKQGKNIFIIILQLLLPLIAFFGWLVFNYFQTGNPIFFLYARQAWSISGIHALVTNISLLLHTPFLPLHSFHMSQLDNCMVIISLILIIKSKKFLPMEFWVTSCMLWLTHILGQDLMSFSRNTVLFFPLFIYLAHTLKGKYFVMTLSCFLVGLLFVSLLFINWYWIG